MAGDVTGRRSWFAQLMNLNWAKIKPVVREQAFQDATLHLELCVLRAALQQSQGRGRAFEHLDGAKYWRKGKAQTALESGALLALALALPRALRWLART